MEGNYKKSTFQMKVGKVNKVRGFGSIGFKSSFSAYRNHDQFKSRAKEDEMSVPIRISRALQSIWRKLSLKSDRRGPHHLKLRNTHAKFLSGPAIFGDRAGLLTVGR
jgi:hypothetical protein